MEFRGLTAYDEEPLRQMAERRYGKGYIVFDTESGIVATEGGRSEGFCLYRIRYGSELARDVRVFVDQEVPTASLRDVVSFRRDVEEGLFGAWSTTSSELSMPQQVFCAREDQEWIPRGAGFTCKGDATLYRAGLRYPCKVFVK